MHTDTPAQSMTLRSWLALFILALSTFTIVSTELIPVGLLTPIAEGLQVSRAAIGMTVSFYAWLGAISALLASVWLGHVAKKRLLLTLTLILLASNALAASVNTYSVLLVARLLGALAHGAFWAMVGATAVALVPAKYIGVATSVVFGGVSAASVVGVPLSNYIGLHFGWRQAFWLMTLFSGVAFIGISTLIPPIASQSAIGTAALRRVLASSALWKIFAATLLAVTAHFAAFTFIEPWLDTQHTLTPGEIPLALLVFGAAGLVGNILTGVVIDRHLKSTVTASVLLMAAVLMGVGGARAALPGSVVFAAVLIWGGAVSGVFVGFQTWVLRLAGDHAFPASALYVAWFNTAIGLGATLGAGIVSACSIPQLYLVAGGAMALSILLVAIIPTRNASVPASAIEASAAH
ncbi:MFS transporter [Pantoea sp. 1.19]|uniref:MFS transporter n=1 Tax=Pantoea sp. 1.19 TaxID=1925589 RepID=UPI000948D586|nr:MFS transporter [Pantoea sp. 1.19]